MINIKNRLDALLQRNSTGEPTWKRFIMRCLQIMYATFRDLADGQLSLRAMSLVYTTLITLVPLLAISFSVLKGFGVHNQMENTLIRLLEGLGPEKSAEIVEKVIGFVDNIQVGVLGAVGLGLLIYAVIALMQKIEAAFNYIWRVGQDRTIAQRFSDYLSVLLMGPLMIFISVGASTKARNTEWVLYLSENFYLVPVFDFMALFLPWLILSIGFTFIYVYMPNMKVKVPAAFAGAIVAAALWKVMGFVFATFIVSSSNYVAIYAAFATLILLMIWLYAIWLVVLIGANVAFYTQYPRYLPVSRETLFLTPHLRMVLGLNILTMITKAYYKDSKNYTLDEIAKALYIPVLSVQSVVGIFIDGGILMASQDDIPQYYPAVPFDQTPIEQAINVLEKNGGQGWLHHERLNILPETQQIMRNIYEARQDRITSQSIKNTLCPDGA